MDKNFCPFLPVEVEGDVLTHLRCHPDCQCWVGGKDGECSFKVIAKSLQQIASKVSLKDVRMP